MKKRIKKKEKLEKLKNELNNKTPEEKKIFKKNKKQKEIQNIRRLKIQWPKDMPPLAKNLIGKILKWIKQQLN